MPELTITNGRVRVDECDLAWALQRNWYTKSGYAKCYSGTPGVSALWMHRLLIERVLGRTLKPDEYVDHINGDRTDNTRSNLRIATKSQNAMNLHARRGFSKFKGVSFDRRAMTRNQKPWMPYINLEGKRWYLGRFESEEEAAWMYDQWAIVLHGDFARLNFSYE